MDVTIRSCRAGDAAALALVGQATFLESYAGMLPAADIFSHCEVEHGVARYAGWLDRPDYRLWLAEAAEGAAPVGYAVVCPPDLPVPLSPGELELKRIYLLHRFHGAGVGARLMAAAVDGARALGAPRLLLGVFGGNRRAIDFYGRQGFVQAGRRKFRVGGHDYDDLVLALSL